MSVLTTLVKLECFGQADEDDFWRKIATYQHYWNLGRFNSYKNNRTPLQILQEAAPRLPPEILLLAPVDLDTLVSAGEGHHVPVLPDNKTLHRICKEL